MRGHIYGRRLEQTPLVVALLGKGRRRVIWPSHLLLKKAAAGLLSSSPDINAPFSHHACTCFCCDGRSCRVVCRPAVVVTTGTRVHQGPGLEPTAALATSTAASDHHSCCTVGHESFVTTAPLASWASLRGWLANHRGWNPPTLAPSFCGSSLVRRAMFRRHGRRCIFPPAELSGTPGGFPNCPWFPWCTSPSTTKAGRQCPSRVSRHCDGTKSQRP